MQNKNSAVSSIRQWLRLDSLSVKNKELFAVIVGALLALEVIKDLRYDIVKLLQGDSASIFIIEPGDKPLNGALTYFCSIAVISICIRLAAGKSEVQRSE